MAKRIHPDKRVKRLSVAGAVIECGPDGVFDIPAELLPHIAGHGFVEPPKAPKASASAVVDKVVVLAQPSPAEAIAAQVLAPQPPELSRKRGRKG
jgi:hypothetical protein